jgi:hypothetical protein
MPGTAEAGGFFSEYHGVDPFVGTDIFRVPV